jgi:hypothetical protein
VGGGTASPAHTKSESVQDCRATNILYESLCSTCNPGGEPGTEGLADNRDKPSIYVGESSRSLKERAGEHVADFQARGEDSHMMKHWTGSHMGGPPPTFHQTVVKRYKSSLARQIGESVRIQMRGKVLNSAGVYNRSKLTRLVVDTDWDKQVWQKSWQMDKQNEEQESRLADQGLLLEGIEEKGEKRRNENNRKNSQNKRQKLENDLGVVWGEEQQTTETERIEEDRKDNVGSKRTTKQQTLRPVTGLEWIGRRILSEIANNAIDRSNLNVELKSQLPVLAVGLEEWEQWDWPAKEKDWTEMYCILDELDKLSLDSKKNNKKKLPGKPGRGKKKKMLTADISDRKITKFFKPTVEKAVDMEWETTLDIKSLTEEWLRADRRHRARCKANEWLEQNRERKTLQDVAREVLVESAWSMWTDRETARRQQKAEEARDRWWDRERVRRNVDMKDCETEIVLSCENSNREGHKNLSCELKMVPNREYTGTGRLQLEGMAVQWQMHVTTFPLPEQTDSQTTPWPEKNDLSDSSVEMRELCATDAVGKIFCTQKTVCTQYDERTFADEPNSMMHDAIDVSETFVKVSNIQVAHTAEKQTYNFTKFVSSFNYLENKRGEKRKRKHRNNKPTRRVIEFCTTSTQFGEQFILTNNSSNIIYRDQDYPTLVEIVKLPELNDLMALECTGLVERMQLEETKSFGGDL